MEIFFHDIFQMSFFYNSEVKEDLFWEENLKTVLKELKNREALRTDCVVNEFFEIWCQRN